MVVTLGKFPLPVEVVRFGLAATRNMVEVLAADAGCEGEIKLRLGADGRPFTTDSGNCILDCAFGQIPDPEALEDALKLVPGVVESGLFLGIADAAVIAGPDGVVGAGPRRRRRRQLRAARIHRSQKEQRMQLRARVLAVAFLALAWPAIAASRPRPRRPIPTGWRRPRR